jgi:hypothetical protein
MAKKSSAAIQNPFETAQTLAPVTSISKGKSAKSRSEVEFENVELLAALQVIKKAIEEEADLLQAQVKTKAIEEFIEGMKSGKKPDSFLAVEGIGQANCEIRKRGSNLAVNAEAAQLLESKGIELEKKVKIPARWVFNPELSQEELMVVGEVLACNPKTKNMAVVAKQPEEFYYVTTDQTLDQIAAVRDESFIRETLESCAVFSVGKFKLDCVDPKAKAIEIAKKKGVL